MSLADYTPEQLAALSTHDIEAHLDRDHVYLPRNSKDKKFQNWAKTFSCEPERGELLFRRDRDRFHDTSRESTNRD